MQERNIKVIRVTIGLEIWLKLYRSQRENKFKYR